MFSRSHGRVSRIGTTSNRSRLIFFSNVIQTRSNPPNSTAVNITATRIFFSTTDSCWVLCKHQICNSACFQPSGTPRPALHVFQSTTRESAYFADGVEAKIDRFQPVRVTTDVLDWDRCPSTTGNRYLPESAQLPRLERSKAWRRWNTLATKKIPPPIGQ